MQTLSVGRLVAKGEVRPLATCVGESGDNMGSVRVTPTFGFSPVVVIASALALGLGAAACGEIPDPDLGAVPTTAVATGSAQEGGDPEGAPSSVEQEPVPVQLTPPRPEGYEPTLVLSTAEGVLVGEPNAVAVLAAPLDTLVASRAADDFFGGLVVQVESRDVLWFPAEGGEGELINVAGGELLDVGFRDGTPEAILTGEGNAIDRVQLVTRERLELTVLPEDRRLIDLSAGAGLFAFVFADENCGGVVFLNSAGVEVDLAGPEDGLCPVPRRPAFGEISLSPDGDAYVYTEIEYRSDGVEASTRLVGREFSTGAELFTIRIGEAGERVRSLTYDGRRVAFLRSSLDVGAVDVLVAIDTSDPELAVPVTDTPASGVTFARLPLTVGGSVDS